MTIKDEVRKEWKKQMIEEYGSEWNKIYTLPPLMMFEITVAKVREKIEKKLLEFEGKHKFLRFGQGVVFDTKVKEFQDMRKELLAELGGDG